MAYIDSGQYISLYGSAPVGGAEFPVYATIASDLIDTITEHRIAKCGGISAFPPLVQSLIQKATAAQVLYLAQNGLEAVLAGQTGQGFTVGKVSVDGGNSGSMTAAQLMVCPMARAYLEQTGLMERSVPCFNQFRPGFFGTL